MFAAIDIGNTRIKIGFFEGNLLHEIRDCETLPQMQQALQSHAVERVIVSSVRFSSEEMQPFLAEYAPLYLSHQTPLPISISYATPHSLGTDRLAMACGAHALYPQGSSLSIALGTCITYNLLLPKIGFVGGAISPGVEMRAKAMHTFTARLPLVSLSSDEISPLGISTEHSLQAGVVHGVWYEILGFIEEYRAQQQDLQIFICGGNLNLFEKKIKEPIFALPELVLVGLNAILHYNVHT
ncbi:type III pantothenate kinase [Cytophagales bacterium LB-30]|uniref:Type III pantothenate kinase n=1 Tax=Shiella aurantiaca TaxID=3058365 RepID=A0ABT8F5R8_9BACT|nr:type III pantothenate kinase [Shiella aurantiaca]MDN4165822.1 type III pantothenate kinase [Shiella aurantiaca]